VEQHEREQARDLLMVGLGRQLASEPDRLAGGGHWELLDRYARRRRTVVRDEIMHQADRNRNRMRLRGLAQGRQELAALRRITADPVALKRHLLRTSMIDGLRRAETIT
jgi:3-(3-hydroxy-phenyl)propionate hydroxylase